MKAFKRRSRLFYLFLSFLILLCILTVSHLILKSIEKDKVFTFNSESSYWPTNGWQVSTPEEQGMDSTMLVKLFDEIKKKSTLRKLKHKIGAKILKERERDSFLITSILIVRNGFIVVEAYSNHDKETIRPIYSSTKSFTSAIFGIALKEQYIKSVDQPVLDFFPELSIQDADPQKNLITLKHLLTMSSGFEWPEWEMGYSNSLNPTILMKHSLNWTKFILNKPITQHPGSQFNYNSGCSYLLLAVLDKIGLDLEDFVQENLFTPLGISADKYFWSKSPNGILAGGGGLSMRTRDMAKFGYLYLKGGFWDGQQIIPKKWVEESTKRHMNIPAPRGWFNGDYGYQWYIHSFGFNSAGHQGQCIFVIPDLEIIVVLTSFLATHETADIISLLKQFVFLSAKSTNPLPDNKKGVAILEQRIKDF